MKTVQARLERLESDGAMAAQHGAVLPDGADANLVAHINHLQTRTLSILQRADAAGRADVALKSVREARSNMELLARLTGQFDRPPEDSRIVVAFMAVPMPQVDGGESDGFPFYATGQNGSDPRRESN
jgi:hypothetical protein